jgi:hypothetical protein
MGELGPMASIQRIAPPLLLSATGEVDTAGVVVAGLLAAGVVVAGEVAPGVVGGGVVAAGVEAAGVVEEGVAVLQPFRMKLQTRRITRGTKSLFIMPPLSYFGWWAYGTLAEKYIYNDPICQHPPDQFAIK